MQAETVTSHLRLQSINAHSAEHNRHYCSSQLKFATRVGVNTTLLLINLVSLLKNINQQNGLPQYRM